MAKGTVTKKYNTTVAPMWTTKQGHYASIVINDEQFDALQKVEKGGKFLLKIVDEYRRKNDKSPHGYLEYITPEDVEAFAKAREQQEETV